MNPLYKYDTALRELHKKRRENHSTYELVKLYGFLTESVLRGDRHAIALAKSLHSKWECTVCGCSDEFGHDWEKICGCDTCGKGCESVESRRQRGAKRPSHIFDARDIFEVISQVCSDTSSCTQITQYILALLEVSDIPAQWAHTEHLIRQILETEPGAESLEYVQMLCSRVQNFVDNGVCSLEHDIGPFIR